LGGTVKVRLAGSGTPGIADGNGTSAQFLHPDAVAVDSFDNVFVADYGNNNIRKIVSALANNQNDFINKSLNLSEPNSWKCKR